MENFEENNVVIENDENNEIEIDIVDDTPEEDRGRKRLEKDVEDPSDDEIEQYSANVQKRIKELSHARHDERRAKESALREREEALEMAKRIFEENNKLKNSLKIGEDAYLEAAKEKALIEYEVAKKKLIEAKSIGDVEAEVQAQEEFNSAQLTRVKLEEFKKNTRQEEINDVNTNFNQPSQVDEKTLDWHKRNPWFWKDKVMTGAALGLHEELVASGYNPASDKYFRELDSRIREIFPKYFNQEDDYEVEEEKQTKSVKRPSTVVASANRSNPSKRITLSASEVSIARRLNIPLEVYAKRKIELEKNNG
jgi:hypothetical protein